MLKHGHPVDEVLVEYHGEAAAQRGGEAREQDGLLPCPRHSTGIAPLVGVVIQDGFLKKHGDAPGAEGG